jgi:hypothetical protein
LRLIFDFQSGYDALPGNNSKSAPAPEDQVLADTGPDNRNAVVPFLPEIRETRPGSPEETRDVAAA